MEAIGRPPYGTSCQCETWARGDTEAREQAFRESVRELHRAYLREETTRSCRTLDAQNVRFVADSLQDLVCWVFATCTLS